MLSDGFIMIYADISLFGWYVLLNLFSFCIYGIFVFFYVIFAPIVCVCEIVIVDILLCGLTCGYAYTSGTCDINLITPFGDEYVCGLQTHLRIVPLLDSLSLVFRDELWYLFQLLLLFREYILNVFCFYSPGVVYI